ncbi:MAG: hypothetical protein AAFY69_11275 [Pseudomonadota bacterium]
MPKYDSKPRVSFRKITEKATYSKAARKKLVELRAKLDGVALIVRHAVATGRVPPSSSLDQALEAMEVNYAVAEAKLRSMQKSGENDWEEQRTQLESAWEDLARSIKQLVARFADSAS